MYLLTYITSIEIPIFYGKMVNLCEHVVVDFCDVFLLMIIKSKHARVN